jgi:K+-transporting ATPase KdpF subunit
MPWAREGKMDLELTLETLFALIFSVLLGSYLIYALLRPEKF